MNNAILIKVKETKKAIESGKALLVCVYDDNKFNTEAHLEGAIPLSRFEKNLAKLPMDQEIIFY